MEEFTQFCYHKKDSRSAATINDRVGEAALNPKSQMEVWVRDGIMRKEEYGMKNSQGRNRCDYDCEGSGGSTTTLSFLLPGLS